MLHIAHTSITSPTTNVVGTFPTVPDSTLQEGEGDSVSLSSCDSRSLSSSSVLVHIWLPSVFLTGTGAARHHVYQVAGHYSSWYRPSVLVLLVSQVYVRLRDSEWNVYRRYSHFHQLHQVERWLDPGLLLVLAQGLRKKHPKVTSFNFPPKRSVGNMKESFVEDRSQSTSKSLSSPLTPCLGEAPCSPTFAL